MGIVIILIGLLLLGITSGYLSYLTHNIAMLILLALGFIFLIVYLVIGLKHWYWLFPSLLLFTTAGTLWVADMKFGGYWIAAGYLFALAVPFGVAYIVKPVKQWWAILPSSVLLLAGLVTLLGGKSFGWALAAGLYVIVLGHAFVWVYVYHRDQWWAILPAGVLTSIGLTVIAFCQGKYWPLWSLAFFGGLSVTFFILWLQKKEYLTGWAKYPSIWLAVSAVIGLCLSINFGFFSGFFLILGGILYLVFFGRKEKNQHQS